jgi:UDP-3-O-[3-hydroxymyristoyl] N-acetylglucosamine deacetylase
VGHPLLASYHAHKSGHGLNNLLLLELLKDPSAYEIVAFDQPGSAPPSYVAQMAREWALT